MKFKNLAILMACFLMFSCSKDETVETKEVKRDIKFNVSSFNQEITDISYTKSLGETVGYLNYMVFNSSGSLVKEVTQTKSDANFGVISDQLAAGSYTIIFIGTKQKPNHINTTSLNENSIYYTQDLASIYDSFYKKVVITVDKNNIAQNVVLDRFVSYVEVVLSDVMPSYVKKVNVNIENEASFFYFNSGETSNFFFSANFEKEVTTADVGKPNFTVGNFSLNTKTPLTINIKAYDVDNKVIAEKKVSNVICMKNRKTILTGKLIEGNSPSSASFTISLNSAFTSPATVNF